MSLFLIIALPFLGALLPGLMYQAGRQSCFLVTFLVTACAAIGLATHAPAVLAGEVVTASLSWLPQLGLNVNLFLDPLGLMFAGLILGIGMLIILYARFYLSRDDNMGAF
ncbi:MAG TPA: monovalent cation/H+ antiporter subunit A, partial [Sulfitobacter pontiacus]|nr:monovalent cation/H+ antiporter subunit A [Sulfitobacter pontiacus]